MADALVIDVRDLEKWYDGAQALDHLTFDVPAGSITGLLGRNGAGKTTTLKLLLGMARPSRGTVRVFGLTPGDRADGVEIRRRTGFVSDDKDLIDGMTVAELVRFTASFFPRWRHDLAERYLTQFVLPREHQVKTLSRGTRTKLALLLALSHGAELLLLDEPTANLDPLVTDEVLQALVSHAANEGTTILFASHHIDEVDQIADRVVMVDLGRTVLTGALDDIRQRYRRVQLVFDHDAPEWRFSSPGIVRTERKGRVLALLSSAGSDAIVAEAQALHPVAVDVTPVTLKDVFLTTVKE